MSLAFVLAVVAAAASVYEITGRVESVRTDGPVHGAIVVLECTCIDTPHETSTDAQGRYRFRGLRAGTYVVRVLKGTADVSRMVVLGFAK